MFEPKNEFTPIPFWFWNDDLTEEEIKRQILEMKDKGVDGFVIHPRKGLTKNIGYLTDTYFHFVKYAVELASSLNMRVVLYDEAMYPSGSCKGMVVEKNPAFASKGLNENLEMVYSNGNIRGVFEGEDDGEPYAPKSADLLNPEAIKCFIHLTHDKYYENLKEYFGNTIIAIFTDEPNILGRNASANLIPWSEGIDNELIAKGVSKDEFRLLFSKATDKKTLEVKRKYKEVIYERMGTAYYKQLSDWCHAHGIGLTGHPEKSTDIGYLKYFDFPCQDVVWRFVAPENNKYIEGADSTMGKCSSDSARHRLVRRNGNECFGCCGHVDDPYAFDENDMLWYLNWLFVRGVNLVYPHAFYYSVRDGRGDERPPEVGMHNPFWPNYRKLSNYIKRMCELQTDVVNQAHIAVLCTHDELSFKIAKPLFENQIEFNYLEEELLDNCKLENNKLLIAKQCYDLVVYDEDFESHASPKAMDFINKCSFAIKFNEADFLNTVKEKSFIEINVTGNKKDVRATLLKKADSTYCIITNEGTGDTSITIDFAKYKIASVEDPYTEEFLDCSPALKLAAGKGLLINLK